MIKLILCAYGRAGAEVLARAAAHRGVDDLFLFTHDAVGVTDIDVRPVADELGVEWTTDVISVEALPFEPDIISSVYYRSIIRPDVIAAVEGRIFNLHPSLLPRHRGCSSIPWAMIEGDSDVGITYHYIDEGVDTGAVLLQRRLPIGEDDTAVSLYHRCVDAGVAAWSQALTMVADHVPGSPQTTDVCYHPRGAPHGGVIDPQWSREHVGRFIRAMTFPPLPYATFDGRAVRSLEEWDALVDGA